MACAPVAHATIHLIDTSNLTFGGSAVSAGDTLSANAGEDRTFKFGGFTSTRLLVNNNTGISFNQVAALANIAFASSARELALNLNLNDPIAVPGRNFSAGTLAPILAERNGTLSAFGNWKTSHRTGYFGFKINHSGHDYYGWMRAQVDFSGPVPSVISLIPKDGMSNVYGAYSDDQILLAGQTSSVPEPSTVALTGLSLLALGGAGLREMRKRRKVQTVAAE